MKFGEDADRGMLGPYGQLITDLIDKGMRLPLQMVALSVNGAVIAGSWSGEGPGLAFHETARYAPPTGERKKTAVLFVDAVGQSYVWHPRPGDTLGES